VNLEHRRELGNDGLAAERRPAIRDVIDDDLNPLARLEMGDPLA
jgi:hypothetical protein